jgi:hypothetical protein
VSTGAQAWLAAREPRPPETMRRRLEVEAPPGIPLWKALADGGLAALGRARSAPGRVRESAFQLLVGDALLTYACEAAVEASDPTAALSSILETVGSAR